MRDKLIAIPTNNLFYWSMMNLGRVSIWGLDVMGEVNVDVWGCEFSLSGNYSYQHAVDISEEGSKMYGHQIAYTPKHSGGADLYVVLPWFEVGYSLVAVGDRYRMGQNVDRYLVEGYVDQGITLRREWILSGMGSLEVQAKVMNLFDVQYEVVNNYPMMGRNYRLKLAWNF